MVVLLNQIIKSVGTNCFVLTSSLEVTFRTMSKSFLNKFGFGYKNRNWVIIGKLNVVVHSFISHLSFRTWFFLNVGSLLMGTSYTVSLNGKLFQNV